MPRKSIIPGVTHDVRPRTARLSKLQTEAQRKVQLIIAALEEAGHTHLWSILSKDRTAVEICDLKAGAVNGHYQLLINGVEETFESHERTVIASAPFGEYDLELPAWMKAYQTLIGAKP